MGTADLGQLTDEQLLARACATGAGADPRRAASALLSRYQRRVYAWCYRHLRDEERARDAAQEVLLSAYRSLGSFGGRSRFSSWLFSIARNRCLSELRRPELLVDEEADALAAVSPEADPERRLLERLDEQAILDLIRDCLEPREQDAIWLRCFERMPVETITEVLGIEEATGARAVLQRARRKLRRALARRRPADEELDHG
jgi:RNA polymerase sigma-70 factor (ECF subfamily)